MRGEWLLPPWILVICICILLFYFHLPISINSKRRSLETISFLEPEKISPHRLPIVSQAVSFLDMNSIKAKEKLHLEELRKKKKYNPPLPQTKISSNIHFLDLHNNNQEIKKKPDSEANHIHFFGVTSNPVPKTVSHVTIDTSIDPVEAQPKLAHPKLSPRPGTDISVENYDKLISCSSQSDCIVPALELKRKYKIYFCKHPIRQGVRFYFLSREGLYLHPNVELVKLPQIDTADYIIYLPGSAPWQLSECNKTEYASKLIVLDEFDGHTMILPTKTKDEYIKNYGALTNPWYFIYFKRSFVQRKNGTFLGYPHLKEYETFPLVYPVAEAYIPHKLTQNRDVEILCTLRGSEKMLTRLRVQNWVAEYGKLRNISKIISGEVDTHQRTAISRLYFENMHNAKIIVTVNPMDWEGDFRLWESIGSGALIFVDPLFVPHPFPLIDKEHVIYFNNHNRAELFEKLDYYRSHPDEARRIALNGYFHAMKYHRTVNLIDYVLRTAHVKERLVMKKKDESMTIPQYNYSGQYLNYMARLQEKMILKCDRPGLYEANGKIPPSVNSVIC